MTAAIDRVVGARYDVRQDYRGRVSSFDPADQEFRLTSHQPGRRSHQRLDGIWESVEWSDGRENPSGDLNAWIIMRGSLTLRKPHPDERAPDVTLREGDYVRLEVKWRGEWQTVWDMHIVRPSIRADGSWSFELADDLYRLVRITDDFAFKRGKKRNTRGWFYEDILDRICAKYDIPFAKAQSVKGKHRIKHFSAKDASVVEAIKKAVQEEMEATGRLLTIRWDQGKLVVVPLRRAAYLYTLREQLLDWTFETSRRGNLATKLTAHAKDKKGKRTKMKVVVRDKGAIRQYGLIPAQESFKGIDDKDELRKRARDALEKRLERVRTATVSHVGIAFVRRGDAVRVVVPEEGYSGADAIGFVQSVTHSLSEATYTMEITLQFIDPQDPKTIKRREDQLERQRKRDERKKRKAAK